MKKFLSIWLAFLMLVCAASPLCRTATASDNSYMTVGTATQKTQYTGEYIIAFNPSLSSSNEISTGSLSVSETPIDNNLSSSPIRIPDANIKLYSKQPIEQIFTKESYSVGDTKTFTMFGNVLEETGPYNYNFQCMAVGTHCYVWQPTNTSANSVFRTRPITTTEACNIKSEFESKYSTMTSAFGTYPSSYGKLNILVYDIQDNYASSNMYVGGYFTGNDIWSWNYLPIIHIDTYPQMNSSISRCYSVLFHELQHLISFTRTNNQMPTWLNEMMSAAAEEITYPGSCVGERIEAWNSVGSEYTHYHAGASLYDFDNSLGAYAMMAMLSQYLRIQTGSTAIYDKIISNIERNQGAAAAVRNALNGTTLSGMNISELLLAFRVATVALNSSGIFGFHGETAYNSLRKVKITSRKDVQGGGAVLIQANGTFNVPSNAGDGLVYVGIDSQGRVYADPTRISGTSSELSLTLGDSRDLSSTLSFMPSGDKVQKYVTWYSDSSSIARINNDGIITGVKEGICTITATTVNGLTYSRTVSVSKTGNLTVTFKDWDGSVLKTEEVPYGGSATAPATPPYRLGYTFIGWDRSFSHVTSSIIVNAVYELNRYTVRFVDGLNGHILDRDTVDFGTILDETTFPDAPDHSGYIFVGWDYDGKKITRDTVITAMYEEKSAVEILIGDVTLDGEINTADAVCILKYSASIFNLDAQQMLNADTNKDSNVNTADAVCILKYSSGLITGF